jgi:two-component system, OmpR family, sensor histidine kinase BaeS
MRLNLSIKFFIAFLATSFTIVAVMVVAMQLYAYQNFSDYIHKVEALRLGELSPILGQEYQAGNGWERLRNDPQLWHELLRPRGSAAYAEKPPSMPSGFESYLKPPPPPPRAEHRDEGRRDRGRRDPVNDALQDGQDRRPPPDEQGAERRPPQDDRDRLPEQPAFGIEHRLALFDEQKLPVIGRAETAQGHTLQEITIEGKTVGWLGLRNEDHPTDPLDTAFLSQQSRAFYLVGAIMLMLAAVVAFLLSRHLLAPVQQLIKGTRGITSRKFDTRISVNSSDELGQLAGDFNQMARTLEQYEQLRQQWVSDISHELRTPLTILRNEVEALQDGVHEVNSKTLASLHGEILHVSKIVNDLHDLSIAESGALTFKKEPVNLLQAVRTCLEQFRLRFNERAISIVDGFGRAEDSIVTGDRDRLMQVFSNLLENSLRYTDSPGCLTVNSLCIGAEVVLQFADTSPGVPPDCLGRLFERLYRVDQSRSRSRGGSGLGLAICKTIVEAHGGKIRAQNAASGGLQVEITLPLHKREHKPV